MSWLIDLVAAIGVGFVALIAVLVLVVAWLTYKARRDPEYQAQIARLHESYAAEKSVIEEAPWFGTTGLSDEVERELPKYLRREFGELLLDDGSLRASDLIYVGRFDEGEEIVHYWRIPPRNGEPSFAYVALSPDGGVFTAWGNREPPTTDAASN